MRYHLIFIVLFVSSLKLDAQRININIGPTISKMEWEYTNLSTSEHFEDLYYGFNTTIGIEYFQKKYFHLNSNIGYYKVGGNGKVKTTDVYGLDFEWMKVTTSLNYLSVNSLANTQIDLKNNLSTYIGIGPQINYLVSYEENAGLLVQFEDNNDLNKTIYGIVTQVGIKYEINKLQLGIIFQHNYHINKFIDLEFEWDQTTINNEMTVNYLTAFFTAGYKLK